MQSILRFGMLYMTFILMVLSTVKGYAQQEDDDQDKVSKMPLEVLVTDMEENPRQGEKIIFINEDTGTQYSGVTNKNGKFVIKLPGSATYEVKIEELGKSQDYQTLEVPTLPEGKEYAKGKFTIQYRPAQVFTLNNVYFDVDKATLREKSYEELNVLKEYLERKQNIAIEIVGHTDNTGEKEHNKDLSERRAERIKQYLTQKGINVDRLKTKGYGETQPVASNDTEKGRQKNRRVEIRIISE